MRNYMTEESKSIWSDCSICEHFKMIGEIQACNLFQITGLPKLFRVGTTKKCCSSFKTTKSNCNYPDIKLMEYAVLYYYNPNSPDKVFEDIDL